MKNPKRGQKMVRPKERPCLKNKDELKTEHDTVQNAVPQKSNYNKSEKNCRQKPK